MESTGNRPEVLKVIDAMTTPGHAFNERRKHPRFPYCVNQSFAPSIDDRMPDPETFRPMRCRDISAGGISFFWPCEPKFERVVIAIGSPPNAQHMLAKIVGCTAADAQLREYIVRCQFLSRIGEDVDPLTN